MGPHFLLLLTLVKYVADDINRRRFHANIFHCFKGYLQQEVGLNRSASLCKLPVK